MSEEKKINYDSKETVKVIAKFVFGDLAEVVITKKPYLKQIHAKIIGNGVINGEKYRTTFVGKSYLEINRQMCLMYEDIARTVKLEEANNAKKAGESTEATSTKKGINRKEG